MIETPQQNSTTATFFFPHTVHSTRRLVLVCWNRLCPRLRALRSSGGSPQGVGAGVGVLQRHLAPPVGRLRCLGDRRVLLWLRRCVCCTYTKLARFCCCVVVFVL